MRTRVSTVPAVPAAPDARIAILFSGGLDCSVLAVVLDRVLPEDEAIDLITVAFENPRTIAAKEGKGGSAKGKERADGADEPDAMELDDPIAAAPTASNTTDGAMYTPPPPNSEIYDVPDRVTARDSWEELKRIKPKRRWNLVEVNVPYRETLEHRQTVIDLMKPQKTVMDLVRRLTLFEQQLSLYSRSCPYRAFRLLSTLLRAASAISLSTTPPVALAPPTFPHRHPTTPAPASC